MCRCRRAGAGHFPILLGILMVVTLASTYILAVADNDVDPFFPYISDTGARRPESSVFGQLLNIAAFIGVAILYLRYRLVSELNRDSDRLLARLNTASFCVGILSAVGISLVANFQETAVLVVHLIGAFLCFTFGVVYACLQTLVSYRMNPLYNGIYICRLRLSIALTTILAYVITLVFALIARQERNAARGTTDIDIFHWKKTDPGYGSHVASAVAEWVLAITLNLFFFTYTREFEKLHVEIECSPLVGHLDETPAPSLSEATRLLVQRT